MGCGDYFRVLRDVFQTHVDVLHAVNVHCVRRILVDLLLGGGLLGCLMAHRAVSPNRFIPRRRVREKTAITSTLSLAHLLLLLLLVEVDDQAGLPVVHVVGTGDLGWGDTSHPDSPLIRPFSNAALGWIRTQRQGRGDIVTGHSCNLIRTILHLV